ncbi:MAG: hypothetical protein P8N76_22500 [Pirellulaceae bacterium]|nr:hypothetical protein [Pirellulaceae bacterium]
MSTLIKSPDGKQKAIMSNDNERFSELAEWLQRQGHSLPEIDKILKKVQEYDQRVNLDSVMDSIDRGDFNISKIIQEALAEAE